MTTLILCLFSAVIGFLAGASYGWNRGVRWPKNGMEIKFYPDGNPYVVIDNRRLGEDEASFRLRMQEARKVLHETISQIAST